MKKICIFQKKSLTLQLKLLQSIEFMTSDFDISQFEQLYRTLFPRLVQFASTYTENEQDAEDIVQQAMVKLWSLLNENENIGDNPRAYLYTMVRNACLDYARHNAYVMENFVRGMEEPVIESLYQYDMAPEADGQTIYNELCEKVDSLIDNMPERQREVFRLSRGEELKNQEIAERLGVSIKAVEKHITASLKYLREHLTGYEMMIFLLFM